MCSWWWDLASGASNMAMWPKTAANNPPAIGATECRVREVYCSVCKSARYVTEACRRRTATKTMAATAGSANVTQEEVTSAEVFNVLQKMTGSAFATATVSTSASGSNNFSPQIKILVDTGNLLSIGMCVSESFF